MLRRTKKILSMSVLILFIISFLFGESVQASATGTFTERQLRDILKQYSPEGNYIVNQYEAKTGKTSDFQLWMSNGTLADLNTVVHETFHGYSYSLVSNFNSEAIYIKDTTTINVSMTEIFNSKVLVNVIPQELRTFRFDTYINAPDSENMSSQVDGIYGLLNEFTAYYHGTKTSYDLYKYYSSLNSTPSIWLEYLQNVYGTYFAYAEFKYYMLKYMEYAKENRPDIYQGIVNNSDFVNAYNNIESLYATMINDFWGNESVILNNMKNNGYRVSKDNQWTYIGNAGVGNYMDTYNTLMTELSKPEYDNLIPKPTVREDFNMDGKVNIMDLALLGKRYNQKNKDSSWQAAFDLNDDSTIDIYDLVFLSKKIK